jgi:hypothetical protein
VVPPLLCLSVSPLITQTSYRGATLYCLSYGRMRTYVLGDLASPEVVSCGTSCALIM